MNNNLTGLAHECSEYEPIQTISNLATSYESLYDEIYSTCREEEDAGCDSCVHFSQNECQIYKRDRSY